jgi:uncharacterized protein YgbK (DUF1537 family)
MTVEPQLLITGDDRTGTLEIGGAVADLGFRVRLTETPDEKDECVLVDIDSRHCAPHLARQKIVDAHRAKAQHRCHKMDSGLRGNWAHEICALTDAGFKVGMLASFPDAGRTCVDGVVYIHGVKVEDSAFGIDPRNPLESSRPEEHLRAAGGGPALDDGNVVILNAADNDQLRAAADQCHAEARMLVGTTGGIGAYVASLREAGRMPLPPLPRPALIVCGSLHPASRTQIARLNLELNIDQYAPNRAEDAAVAIEAGRDAIIISEEPGGPVSDSAAERMCATLARLAWRTIEGSGVRTIVILGGDTAAATLGDRPLRVIGSVDTAVALCRTEDQRLTVVTKGGGIGDDDMLVRILT